MYQLVTIGLFRKKKEFPISQPEFCSWQYCFIMYFHDWNNKTRTWNI